MVEVGDLTKLLEQGFLNSTYVYEGPDGKFEFKLKTLLPLEEVAASRDTDSRFEEAGSKDDNAKSIFLAIETLIRCVETVNGVPLEQVPGAEGETPLKKRRSLANRFSQKLLLDLWAEHQKLRSKMFPTGSEEEEEALKK